MGIGSRSTTPSNKTSKTPNLDMEVEEDYDVIELPHPKQVNCWVPYGYNSQVRHLCDL